MYCKNIKIMNFITVVSNNKISTFKLKTSQLLHIKPIHVVIFYVFKNLS